MDELRNLEERLGIQFGDYSLYTRALTHRSFVNENPGQTIEDNERLEFLGDAVLDFVVGAFLYDRLPEMKEGELTMLRAALVRTKTLAGFAQRLDMGQALRLGHGEAESGGRGRQAILCAAFEALVGAMYLDQGLKAVDSWLQELMAPALEQIMAASAHRDAKSEFQIWAQGRLGVTPGYRLVAEEGPDHDKTFTVAVVVDGEQWAVGQGRSKQLAEQVAAAGALARAIAIEDQELEESGSSGGHS